MSDTTATATADAPVDVWEVVAALIDELLPEGEFVTYEVAQKVLRAMEERHSEKLGEFYEDLALRAIGDHLRELQRRRQSKERKEAKKASTDEQIAEAVKDGSLSPFTSKLFVGKGFKPVGEMTGEDHMFVSSKQKARGRTCLLLAKFHEQVAMRVKRRTTAEVMDEETYLKLRRTIVGDDE